MKRLLVFGARGMLAGHLLEKLLPSPSVTLTDRIGGTLGDRPSSPFPLAPVDPATPIVTCDITSRADTLALIQEVKPDWVINCAAYTLVDICEEQKDLAFSVNAIGPLQLALGCSAVGARLLHISSDYVFGARTGAPIPIREEEEPAPCGIYGHSKRFGDELALLANPGRTLVLRTSWLHGLYGPSFVASILRAASERPELRVVNDQTGSPTWAGWLADVMLQLVAKDASGVFHTSSRGGITWYDFAQEIVKRGGKTAQVLPQTTEECARPAPRPPYSTLDVSKLESFLDMPAPTWQAGLQLHLDSLEQK